MIIREGTRNLKYIEATEEILHLIKDKKMFVNHIFISNEKLGTIIFSSKKNNFYSSTISFKKTGIEVRLENDGLLTIPASGVKVVFVDGDMYSFDCGESEVAFQIDYL